LNIKDLNEAVLLNPRNCYQNYNVAVNCHSDRPIFTYLGQLKPDIGNANYSSAGQLSPLFNDPLLRTIGVGTQIFLGGGTGYVYSQGTQHNPGILCKRGDRETYSGATLAVTGDLKKMSPRWLVGASIRGYGASLFVGIGIPIPVLDEEILYHTTVCNSELCAPIVDYSRDYPQLTGEPLGYVSYEELRSGEIEIDGKKVPTASMSSYPRALEIANILKEWISKGEFTLTEKVASLPGTNESTFKNFNERPVAEDYPE
jgi:uncharacterized protein (DUF39 family)